MDIRFRDEKLRKLCEIGAHAERKLGSECAKRLRSRLSDLDAAACVTELRAGRPHPLTGDRTGQFALNLDRSRRLVFAPAQEPYPHLPDGGIDWSRVTAVRIEFIGDYHD